MVQAGRTRQRIMTVSYMQAISDEGCDGPMRHSSALRSIYGDVLPACCSFSVTSQPHPGALHSHVQHKEQSCMHKNDRLVPPVSFASSQTSACELNLKMHDRLRNSLQIVRKQADAIETASHHSWNSILYVMCASLETGTSSGRHDILNQTGASHSQDDCQYSFTMSFCVWNAKASGATQM